MLRGPTLEKLFSDSSRNADPPTAKERAISGPGSSISHCMRCGEKDQNVTQLSRQKPRFSPPSAEPIRQGTHGSVSTSSIWSSVIAASRRPRRNCDRGSADMSRKQHATSITSLTRRMLPRSHTAGDEQRCGGLPTLSQDDARAPKRLDDFAATSHTADSQYRKLPWQRTTGGCLSQLWTVKNFGRRFGTRRHHRRRHRRRRANA